MIHTAQQADALLDDDRIDPALDADCPVVGIIIILFADQCHNHSHSLLPLGHLAAVDVGRQDKRCRGLRRGRWGAISGRGSPECHQGEIALCGRRSAAQDSLHQVRLWLPGATAATPIGEERPELV